MKKRIIAAAALIAIMSAMSGCTAVEDKMPEESTTTSLPVEGSMVVSFGYTSAETTVPADETEADDTSSRVTTVPGQNNDKSTTAATSQKAETTRKKTETSAEKPKETTKVTKATTAITTVPTTVATTVTTEDPAVKAARDIKEYLLDSEYIKAVVVMEQHPDVAVNGMFDAYKIQILSYFDGVAESYYNAAVEYYNEQVAKGNKCATGFEGYNMVNSTLDPFCLTDRVPDEYVSSAPRVIISCSDDRGISVRIPVFGMASSYP